MKTQLNINKLIARNEIQTALEFERALVADRKLRVLAKEDPKLKTLRVKLRDLIEAYENKNWSEDSEISADQLRDSDIAESIVEKERQFVEKRKELIKAELKMLGLTQQEFGKILGHDCKSYISELMNGISPFSMKDIVVIHRLFKIELIDLVPIFLTQTENNEIKRSIQKLKNPKLDHLKLSMEDFVPV